VAPETAPATEQATADRHAPSGRRRLRRSLTAGSLAAFGLFLAGCNTDFAATPGTTSQSHDEFRLWHGMMIAGFAVAIFVWILIFWSIIRYRKRRADTTLPKQFHEHIGLEWTYTIIPLLMVGVIFYFTVIVENNVDSTLPNPAVIINVFGYQWGWKFEYSKPGGGIVVQTAPGVAPKYLAENPLEHTDLYPQMVLPVNETVRFFLRSTDVIHGFYVHDWNFSRYVQPGVVNSFDIKPTVEGYSVGQCTQYCGLYHSEMLFSVKVVSQQAFNTWVSQQLALHPAGSS
jgi:cytochrome c oxidase subunit 2